MDNNNNFALTNNNNNNNYVLNLQDLKCIYIYITFLNGFGYV